MRKECMIIFWGVLVSTQTGNIYSYRAFEGAMTLHKKGVCEFSPALCVCVYR